MVTYTYNVDPNGGIPTIQQAINSVVSDLANGTVPTEDIFIFVADGTYAGFTIPNGGLISLMGTSFRLIIKPKESNYFPVIDFNKGSNTQVIGADIGSANPNVTIEGLRFQFFAVGIRSSLNSHNPKINKCIVANCRNTGIFIDQCNNAQILQCVVTNGDYGIVGRLCKNLALIHNTVFLNGAIATKVGEAKSAIWCQLANDYGNGLTDTGKLYLVGNIAWNLAGATLSLFNQDVERSGAIISNYNDFVIGQQQKYITIEDGAFHTTGGSSPRRFITSLGAWKSLGFDLNSKAEDPRFISPVKIGTGRSKYAIDLNLLPNSPVRGLVPNFITNVSVSSLYLPNYVDSTDLRTDILNNVRQSTYTTAGANDRQSTNSFFGSDVFSSPLDITGNANCGANPIVDIISKKLDMWYPKYKTGFFYSFDREYYLYARKGCSYIGELAVTKFNLPYRVDRRLPVVLYVNGQKVSSSDYLDIIGDEIHLYHKNLGISSGDEEIELQYSIPSIKTAEGSYLSSSQTYTRFKIKDGKTRYFLPKSYVARGPVIITDDAAYASNHDLVTNREFAVVWDKAYQAAEIVFHKNQNLIQNAQFDYFPSGLPIRWASTGAIVEEGTLPNYSVAGANLCNIYPSGYIQQELPITSGQSVFSWYSFTTGTSSGNLEIKFYDGQNKDLGYIINKQFNTNQDWKRYYVVIGPSGTSENLTIPEDYQYVELDRIHVPENSDTASIKLSPLGNQSLKVSAAQYEHESYPTYYHRQPYGGEMTVEYETSNSLDYIDSAQAMASTITTQNEGFLYIPELPASAFSGPADLSITTLHEWRWPEGRRNLLPWGRTAGKDKLRRRTINTFHAYPQKSDHPVSPVFKTPGIKDIELIPSTVYINQGDEAGVTFTINVTDENGNPFANASFSAFITDEYQRFPGWLHKKYFGAKQQLGPSIFGKLDSGGNVCLTWVPPAKENVALVTNTPYPTSTAQNGQSISIIRTKYPVNLDYNGNVSILDNNGNLLNKLTDVIKGIYRPAFGASQSVITLEYPPKLGSMSVVVDSEYLTEVYTSTPESNQFYIDYSNGILYLKGRRPNVYLEYTPTYTFINQNDLYKIILFHDKVFAGYDGPITVGHDLIIKLTVNVLDYSTNSEVTREFDLVALNHVLTEKSSINKAYLEI
jgi:hypothetical protein